MKKDEKLYKALIDGGAELFKEDARGFSSYAAAINSGNEEIARIAKSIKPAK